VICRPSKPGKSTLLKILEGEEVIQERKAYNYFFFFDKIFSICPNVE
jgi:hypothetical protein